MASDQDKYAAALEALVVAERTVLDPSSSREAVREAIAIVASYGVDDVTASLRRTANEFWGSDTLAVNADQTSDRVDADSWDYNDEDGPAGGGDKASKLAALTKRGV